MYKLFFDNNDSVKFYEDILIKYGLFIKKDIDYSLLSEIEKENYIYGIYDEALKFIETRLRSREEVFLYLIRKKYDEELIVSTIERLEKNHYIDDALFAKAYLNDKISLSNDGPNKIRAGLENLKVDASIIDGVLSNLDKTLIRGRIRHLLEKKMQAKSKYTKNALKLKLMTYMVQLGYDREDVYPYLYELECKNRDINLDYQKLLKKYSKKYDGYKLKSILFQKLYQLGYEREQIEFIIKE